MEELKEKLEFAVEAAARGSEVAMAAFGTALERERKKDGTWVTEADRAAESAIRKAIAAAWPDHNVLGEEEGLTGARGGSPAQGAPTWIVDPIDGTNNFMAGIQVWATLVGLAVDGRNVVGAVSAPALGETYDGAIGLGARLNGQAIRVSPVERLADATVVYAGVQGFEDVGLSDFFARLTADCWRSRGFGDFWGHMLVARGAVHAMVEPELSVWDVAALDPIVAEAGGRLTHVDGTRWTGEGSCLTTCGAIHDEITDLLWQTAPGWSEGPTTVPSDARREL